MTISVPSPRADLRCPTCSTALIPMLLFGEEEWRYGHPWPSACELVEKKWRQPVMAIGMVSGLIASVSCEECGNDLYPCFEKGTQGLGSRERRYVHKLGAECGNFGKKFKVREVRLEVCDG